MIWPPRSDVPGSGDGPVARAVTGSMVERERKLVLMPKRRNKAAMLVTIVDRLELVGEE